MVLPETRRNFLYSAAALGSAVAVSCKGGRTASPWRFFTVAEAETVDAVCEQLIPADRDPGAKEARVVNYIDIQLSRTLRRHRQAYREGVAAIGRTSRSKFGRPFVELTPEQQVEALKAVEESSKAFFELLLAHTRQGFYGDPRHGGNRNRVSWKMVGLPFPPVRGREHYDGTRTG